MVKIVSTAGITGEHRTPDMYGFLDHQYGEEEVFREKQEQKKIRLLKKQKERRRKAKEVRQAKVREMVLKQAPVTPAKPLGKRLV